MFKFRTKARHAAATANATPITPPTEVHTYKVVGRMTTGGMGLAYIKATSPFEAERIALAQERYVSPRDITKSSGRFLEVMEVYD